MKRLTEQSDNLRARDRVTGTTGSADIGPEFALACACAAWPPTEPRLTFIRGSSQAALDWALFLSLVRRHRIVGLVQNALTVSAAPIPENVKSALQSEARQIAVQNLLMAAETVRLQQHFDRTQIRAVFLKGAALAKLCYGDLSLKQAKDIDILVLPESANAALHALEDDGYRILFPAESPTEAQRAAMLRFTKEAVLVHRESGIEVELHWALAENPVLLKDVNAASQTQSVELYGGHRVCTLSEENLFAYLCVHGALHAWMRLKWLADLHGLVSKYSEQELERLYRFAEERGAAVCAGLALRLCAEFWDLAIPRSLAVKVFRSRRLGWLARISRQAMGADNDARELHDRGLVRAKAIASLFLLGAGPRYLVSQLRAEAIGNGAAIATPLPRQLHFLYYFMRLPIFIWRRLCQGYGLLVIPDRRAGKGH